MLEGAGRSWDDGATVAARGIIGHILEFVHSRASRTICQVSVDKLTNVEGRGRKTEKKMKPGSREGGLRKGRLYIIAATGNKTRR